MNKLKILVVDDAPFIRDLVKKAIKVRFPGAEVAEAINGRKAQQLLSRNSVDLVLCDWEMPEMSGIELLQWLRGEHGDADTPFVMVTSRGDKANVVAAIQAGVTDYIGKPFTNEQLLAKVMKVLGKHHDLKALMGQRPVRLSGGVAEASISALTGKPAPAAKESRMAAADSVLSTNPLFTRQAPKQPAPTAPASKPQSAAGRPKGSAYLRFRDQMLQGVIKAISLKEMTLVVRSRDGIPGLLEQAVVDLQQGDGASAEVARLNGYIHSLQALEPKIDSALVSLVVHFVDKDPQKLDYLSRMIATGTTSSHYVPGA